MKPASQLLIEYTERYPIYKEVVFSEAKNSPEKLPALYILTQHIVDTLIAEGKKRIAIILPDNDCNILPLVLAKYFSNVQNESEYAGNVLDEIQKGQHLRLGDAVIEFVEIDKSKNTIKYIVGKETKSCGPSTVTAPIKGIHYLLEKTEGAISAHEAWYKSCKKAKDKTDITNAVSDIKAKRTALKKTILFLSPKNDFREFTETLRINGNEFKDIISFGEIDADAEHGFNLYNKGRLDCLPALSVGTRLGEIWSVLKNPDLREKVFAIFCIPDKFSEVIGNLDTLKKCLKHDIPFITFVPESEFEDFPLLADSGFEMWHWKPSMMHSEVFLEDAPPGKSKSLFGRLIAKSSAAALAEYDVKKCGGSGLKNTLKNIRRITELLRDDDNAARKMLGQIWVLQTKLSSLLCKTEKIQAALLFALNGIISFWNQRKAYYAGQEIERIFNAVVEAFKLFINEEETGKIKLLADTLSELSVGECAVVLVSDKYEYLDETKKHFALQGYGVVIKLLKLSEFYAGQEKTFTPMKRIIVTWFDRDEYIKIKQTYCYEKLIFVLYDFENKWRESFVVRFNECLPHSAVKSNAERIGLSDKDFSDIPIDSNIGEYEQDDEYKEIEDFNYTKSIVRAIVPGGGVNADASDSVEVVPTLLSGDYIGYFYPTRDIIDITGLISGDGNRPLKKEASKLRKGDRILVRQRDRDIIREKADELMRLDGKSALRETSSRWSDSLAGYAKGKTISTIYTAIKNNGGDCTSQQIRYWLDGDTICPDGRANISAILKVADGHDPEKDIERIVTSIIEAGREVRSYHQRAGGWLSRELKNKAKEIQAIIKSGNMRGTIESIGEVFIYTVEEILDKDFVSRGKLNKVEVLF